MLSSRQRISIKGKNADEKNPRSALVDDLRGFINCFADCYFQMRNGGDNSASEGEKEEEKNQG